VGFRGFGKYAYVYRGVNAGDKKTIVENKIKVYVYLLTLETADQVRRETKVTEFAGRSRDIPGRRKWSTYPHVRKLYL